MKYSTRSLPPILVVDDDDALRRALARILGHEGYSVLEAADGVSAIELTRQHDPSIVLLDHMMPGMDGETVIAVLQREMEEDCPPILLLTASDRQRSRALEMGAKAGLLKPFRVEELLGHVRTYRRRGRQGGASHPRVLRAETREFPPSLVEDEILHSSALAS